jgi:dihydrofolate reductase
MARIVVSEYITLDGVVEDPGGAEHFEHGGWSFQSFNDEYFSYKHAELFACGCLLLGRVTYQALQAAWPMRSDATGLSGRMNSLPKYVVSQSLNDVSWYNSTIIRPPLVEPISQLKSRHTKDILVIGSRMLVQLLMAHDLVDEYRLLLHPIVLGNGQKLFEDTKVRNLRLTGTRSFATGVVVLTYVPDRSKVVVMQSTGPAQASSSR